MPRARELLYLVHLICSFLKISYENFLKIAMSEMVTAALLRVRGKKKLLNCIPEFPLYVERQCALRKYQHTSCLPNFAT